MNVRTYRIAVLIWWNHDKKCLWRLINVMYDKLLLGYLHIKRWSSECPFAFVIVKSYSKERSTGISKLNFRQRSIKNYYDTFVVVITIVIETLEDDELLLSKCYYFRSKPFFLNSLIATKCRLSVQLIEKCCLEKGLCSWINGVRCP